MSCATTSGFRPGSRTLLTLLWAFLLAACATPSMPPTQSVYDFGAPAAPASDASPAQAPLALADIQTAWDSSSTTMQYRLAYAHEQALMPYAMARWSMPPAQLVAQRVRSVLAQQRPVVPLVDRSTVFELQLALEAFEHTFDTPLASRGTVRLRATLYKSAELVAQREFLTSQPAPTQDAAGGVRALRDATQAAASELAIWLDQRMR